MYKPNEGFIHIEAVVRPGEKVKKVVNGNMPKSDYFVRSIDNKDYPVGTELVLRGTAILHTLKDDTYAIALSDIIGIYA